MLISAENIDYFYLVISFSTCIKNCTYGINFIVSFEIVSRFTCTSYDNESIEPAKLKFIADSNSLHFDIVLYTHVYGKVFNFTYKITRL